MDITFYQIEITVTLKSIIVKEIYKVSNQNSFSEWIYRSRRVYLRCIFI